nr:energy transducer TonB [Vibrio ostreicida]
MVDMDNRSDESSQPVSFNMVMVDNEQQVNRRRRTIPKPPETPEIPEQKALTQSSTKLDQFSSIPKTSLALNTNVQGLSIIAPTFGDFNVSQQVLPLYRVEPRYPTKAKKRRVEGYVVLVFTIDPTGKPVDIQISDASPKRMFEREAITALKKWRYQPKLVDGVAVSQVGRSARVEFKLPK